MIEDWPCAGHEDEEAGSLLCQQMKRRIFVMSPSGETLQVMSSEALEEPVPRISAHPRNSHGSALGIHDWERFDGMAMGVFCEQLVLGTTNSALLGLRGF